MPLPKRLSSFIVMSVIWLFSQFAIAAEKQPQEIVENFHVSLIDVMKNAKALGFQGRYTKLDPVIAEAFNLPTMMQIASGSFWRKASPAEKSTMTDVFRRISVGTYANRFVGYSGQSFKTIKVKEGPQNTRLVETELVNPDGDDVDLTYVMLKSKGNWRIIDVLLGGGISEIALRRSEYRRILKNEGVQGLVNALGRKADAMKTQ